MKTRYSPLDHVKPFGLDGISDEQIKDHWGLYEGYVKQTNTLLDDVQTLNQNQEGASLTCADRRRRLGFEFNGMIMHELYFQNMTSVMQERDFDCATGLNKSILENFGSVQDWMTEFKNIGKTRGPGWVILGQNPNNGDLLNYFVQEHENGQIAGFNPILVMDIWEHAYMLDYRSSGRASYVDAFTQNINWKVVSERYKGHGQLRT